LRDEIDKRENEKKEREIKELETLASQRRLVVKLSEKNKALCCHCNFSFHFDISLYRCPNCYSVFTERYNENEARALIQRHEELKRIKVQTDKENNTIDFFAILGVGIALIVCFKTLDPGMAVLLSVVFMGIGGFVGWVVGVIVARL
jgi:hypothetical protein